MSIEDGYDAYYSTGKDPKTTSSYHTFLVENGFMPKNGERFTRSETAQLAEEFSKPAFLAKEASRFIRDHQDHAFVLYVNFLEPHMPYFGPRDDQYDPAKIPLPANFEAELDLSQPLKTRVFAEAYRENGHDLPLQSRKDWQRMIANYWGLCSLIDTHIGSILNTLEACDLGDNTIVVFTSDHGDMMGSHKLIAKCVMFEEAARVPLIIRLPGQKEGKRIAGPVSQIDLVPTLLALLDQPIPPVLQGQSLRELLEAEDACCERNVFLEWNGPNSGVVGEAKGKFRAPSQMDGVVSNDELEEAVTDPVRTVITTDGWKLNYSPRGEHELYHLSEDPGEIVNLFGQEKYESVVDELVDQIVQWQKRTGDAVDLPLRASGK